MPDPGRITIVVDGRTAEVPRSATVLDAARQAGISIPTLCHAKGLSPYGACRVCVVEIESPRGGRLVASCAYPVEEGLVVRTDTGLVRSSRRTVLELLLAQAPQSAELAAFASGLGVESTPLERTETGKCILCGLCVRVCNDLMGRGAISLFGRGPGRNVRTAYSEPTDQCQACGACAFVCPTGAIDLATITSRRPRPHKTNHDQHLTARPCIDLAHPQAAPRVPFIDRDACVHFRTGECGLCSTVCQAGAVDYDQAEETLELKVGGVVLTPGFEAFDATRRGEFGFGFAPNVLTNVQFERMLSASGPTRGHLVRPSDGTAPKRLAFIQCVGSRDAGCDNDYCSSVCCMAATKEAILAREHEPGLEVTVFFLDLRAFGKDFDRYYERARKQLGVRYVRSFISRTYVMPGTKNLRLVHMTPGGKQSEEEFDMVVLSLGLEPGASLAEQAKALGVALNRWGFAQTGELAPLDTTRPGVFVGGAFQEPKDIPDTVMQASAAASRAMSLLAPARGTLVRKKSYPPQRDVTDEPPRIGVFVCHCGSNIASVVDVEAVVQRAGELPHVVLAEHNVYACASNNQDLIKEKIAANGLNRLVIASCTPRTHEPIFRDTMRDAGLNPYLFEMANIRDQCSWVHSATPEKATAKAVDLVRMAVGRAARLLPLNQETVPVSSGALVVGGGIAGMTAALALAEQGFRVHLVEKASRLGGTVREIHRTIGRDDVQAFLDRTIQRVKAGRLITVHRSASVVKVEGNVGSFTSRIFANGQNIDIRHGVVVVATGATEKKPETYGYGRCDRVLTQLELSGRLERGEIDLSPGSTVAMIQCVEQRSGERPYCSRVCCATAVKNALLLKEKFPDARIVVLYRDMRTYGFREAAYREAREKGVLFVRYEPERMPELTNGGKLDLRVFEPTLGRDLRIEPDLVILAAPMEPRADRKELSELLRVPLNADGFFLEAHMKLRPVDFASEGIFLCGTAHSPKFIGETVSQANAVAARAATILSHKRMPVSGQISYVDPDKCVGCMTCVHLCPYMAPRIGADNKAEVQGVVCMGCGSCASECPAKAITLRHYVDFQVLAAVNSLLGADPEEKPAVPAYPDRAGIAPPKWHRS
ncbi:MAG: FAD-dependent oxidoreductase [Deltaproteobacteria bacterium]|nr:FAD-dependent oxidoreductase [Deltaproteobacteria bacterium]